MTFRYLKDLRMFFSLAIVLFGGYLSMPAAFADESQRLSELDVPAAVFDGRSTYIEAEHDDALQLQNGGTLEAWIKITGTGDSDWMRLLSKSHTTGHAGGWELAFQDHSQLHMTMDGRAETLSEEFSLQHRSWHHVAVSFDGESWVFFINGEKVRRFSLPVLPPEDDTPLVVGDAAAGSRKFEGKMKEVRIWDHAREAREIRDYYDQRLGGDEDGLLLYWPMGEGGGDKVQDRTANQNHGHIAGQVEWALARPFLRDLEDKPVTLGTDIEIGPVELRDPVGEVRYQWYFDGEPLEGETKSSLEIPKLAPENLGEYYVRVHDDRNLTPVDSREIRVEEGPLWTLRTNGFIFSSPAVGGEGNVYAGSFDGQLYALSPQQGELKWTFDAGSRIRSSPAAGFDGTVYTGAFDGNLYALDPEDGTEKWSFSTQEGIGSSPAVDPGGTVYTGSDDGNLYAIDSRSGEKRWSFATGGRIRSSPVIGDDGTVYFGSDDHRVYALNDEGTKKWSFPTDGAVRASPSLSSEGVVFAGSDDSRLYALDAEKGDEIWHFETGGWVRSSVSLGEDGKVFFGSDDGKVYALCLERGQKQWVFQTGDWVRSSPAVGGDGKLYIGSDDRNVYVFCTSEGSEIRRFPTDGWVRSSPRVEDQMLYFGSADAYLYAFEVSTGEPAESCWPKYRHNSKRTGWIGGY